MLYPTVPASRYPVAEIIAATEAHNGASFTADGRNVYGAPFYAVSVNPEHERIVNAPLSADVLERYIAERADIWDDAHIIGTWQHDGRVYLDVVTLVSDLDDALALARQHGQLAIFDLANGEEISAVSEVAA